MDKVAHASQEIRRAAAAHGVEIGNSIACGKLDATAHAEHETALASPEQADAEVHRVYPRVLILDSTRLGSISATGQVKKRLFDGWATGRLLQIHAVGRSRLGIYRAWEPMDATPTDEITAFEACRAFHPDVIYYRPHEKPAAFHRWAEQVIDELGAPVVTHLMDDWIRRLGSNTEAERSLRLRLERSAACLSIGEAMSVAFQDRFGVTFQPVANCVEPDQWLALEHCRINRKLGDPVIMRYVGGLPEDMTRASVVDVARAVDNLHGELGLVLEVHTMNRWLLPAKRAFACLHGVSVHLANLSEKAHQRLLVESDVLLIAYNFDETSMGYVRYSIANKMPEYLAAGVPVLAYGPRGLATIDYLATSGIAEVVAERDSIALSKALRRLVTDGQYAIALAERGRQFAFKWHACDPIRKGFHQVLCNAAGRHGWTPDRAPLSAYDGGLLGTFVLGERAHFDEVVWVSKVLGSVSDGVMVAVGAHQGRAIAGLLDRGWQVYAFEPDETKRARLEADHRACAKLVVDDRAVKVQSRVSFVASGESSEISALPHQQIGMMATTSIEQAVQQHGIRRIDLLKIDAAGYDPMVLKSIPWAVVRPVVVVCEFADPKSVLLGYRLHDMAQYLLEQGYQVWVSEWHPVVEYGVQHAWRRLASYPCHLASADAWGALVAFQHGIPEDTLREAASTVLKSFALECGGEAPPVTIEKADAMQVPRDSYVRGSLATPHGVSDKAKAQSPLPPRMRALFYEQFAAYLSHPGIARIARFAVWNLRAMRQHPVAAGACGLFLAGWLVTLLWMGEHRTLPLWTALAAIFVFFGTVTLSKIEELERQCRTLSTVTVTLDDRVANLDARFAKLAEVINGGLGALETDLGRLEDDLRDAFADLDAQLRNMRGSGATASRPFAWQLAKTESERIQGHWLPQLGLYMGPERLDYMAHRIVVMEDRCTGRLAGPVCGELLRCLVARSVTGQFLGVLEIGARFGINIACIYDLCRDLFENLHLTLIDPLEGCDGGGELGLGTPMPKTRNVLMRNLHAAGIPENDCTIISWKNSDAEVLARAKAGRYDLLIIAGDHAATNVANAFYTYRPMVKPGGYVLFDGYAVLEWPAIKAFVDGEIVGRDDMEFIGDDWGTAVFKVRREY